MFIVDSSEKARALLFERQKEFILRFSTKLLQLHSDGWRLRLRLAALQYSSTVSVEHNFRDWQDVDVFQSRVAAMSFIGHGTYSAYGITNATQVFSRETSPSSLRVALLMTDGTDHPRSPSAVAAAAEAKQQSIRVFVIRMSGQTNDGPMVSKLRSIASAPPQQHVLSLTDNQLDDRLFRELVSRVFKCLLMCHTDINVNKQVLCEKDPFQKKRNDINQSIKLYFYSPYSQITICHIGLNKVRQSLSLTLNKSEEKLPKKHINTC